MINWSTIFKNINYLLSLISSYLISNFFVKISIGNYCVPAGSEILTATQILCPRHYKPPKKGPVHHINASWCFICSIGVYLFYYVVLLWKRLVRKAHLLSYCVSGGSLICCDLCPSSFHVDCLKIKSPTGGYICEDCETGRFPLYNEVLWVKLGTYR